MLEQDRDREILRLKRALELVHGLLNNSENKIIHLEQLLMDERRAKRMTVINGGKGTASFGIDGSQVRGRRHD
jgi:hypothetical protein